MASLSAFWRYGRRNPKLLGGLLLILVIVLIGLVGRFFVNLDDARPISAMPEMSPTWEHPFGTDGVGRDLFTVMVAAIPLALEVGLLAGAVGLGIGTILGFIAGYKGGMADNIIRGVVDTLLTVPGLVVLITITASIKSVLSVEVMALVVASLAWMWPTRTIRSQVLTMRERAYVKMAKLNGLSTMEIIWQELLPNLLPYLGASYVGAVSSAILASIGLEALGLGPQNEPTIGMTIYWAIANTSLIRGIWWWWLPPILFVIMLFIGLFMISAGLDEVANPRLRRTV
ncbi:MAG: ABC transporter permease [Chloroflexi bacterium]|nr:ABC transporter permease [Chloroflexota bacterium]